MLKTKATLKTMEKLFAKRITTFVCLLGSSPKLKFNFATKIKNKNKNTTASLHKSTFCSNLFCKSYTINNFNKHYC